MSPPADRLPFPPIASQAATLLAQTLRRRQLWRRLIGAELLLLALLFFLAMAGLGAVVLVAIGEAGAVPWLALAAGLLGLSLAGWHAALRLRVSRNLGRWAAEQIILFSPGAADAEALRSALDLASRTGREGALGGGLRLGSAQLVARSIAAGSASLAGLDEARRQLRLRLRQYGVLLGISLAAWAWSVVATPQVWRTLLEPPGRTPPAAREVGTLIGDAHLRVEPPAYARAAVDVRHEDSGEANVLRGSRVTVTAAQLPAYTVQSVELESLVPGGVRGEVVPVAPAGGERVQWTRTALEPMRYRYRGLDARGLPVRELGFRDLALLPDAPPSAIIRSPEAEIEVRPGQSVAVLGEVSDDIGLSLVNLVIARPATGVERRPVALPADGVRKAVVKEAIAVDALQLRPGEVALVHIEAADHNPLDGRLRSASSKVRIRMFSAERHHAHNLDQLAELTAFWTQRLGDRLEQDPVALQSTALATALRARAGMADQELRGVDGLRALREALQEDVLSRKSTVADLGEIERRLGEQLGDEARVVHRMDPAETGYGAVRELYALQRHHALVLAAQEESVLALAALASTEHQGALARDGKSLAEAEKQLLSTLEKLADGHAAPLQAEAERLLDTVEQQLERMAAAAQKQAHIVPYEHVNEQGLDATGLQRDLGDHRQSLAEVRRLLRAGKTREALDEMRRIQAAMQAVTGNLQQGIDRQRSAEEQALERLAQELRRGIARAQQGQGQLRDDLRPSAEEQHRAAAEHLRSARNTIIPQVIQLLNEAREQIRPQRLTTPALHGSRPLAGARTALGTALGALEDTQIDGALQALTEVEDLLGAARRSLRGEDEDLPPAARADAHRLGAAAERVARAAARLREALPPAYEMLRPPTRAKLEDNSMQQEQLRRALDKVRAQLAAGAGAHPAMQRQVGDRLQHALQTMRETAEALQRYDAARAFEQTAETLDALERALGLLESQGGQPSPQPAAGAQVGHGEGGDPVELRTGKPGEDGERFRQDVLRAMQGRVPGGFRERLDRYYKAISR